MGSEHNELDPRGAKVVVRNRAGAFRSDIRAGAHALVADEPVDLGGTDAGPAPYDLLLSALGACTAMTIRMYADRKGWPLEEVSVRLSHKKIPAEECATCETKVGKIDHIDRAVELIGPLDDEQRARLLDIAEKCPVHRTLHAEIDVRTTLST